MQILYLTKVNTFSNSLSIGSFYQPKRYAEVQEGFVKINGDRNRIIYKTSSLKSSDYANNAWRNYRVIGYMKIGTIEVYGIMTNLRGHLNIHHDFLSYMKTDLASPFDFYENFIDVFRLGK